MSMTDIHERAAKALIENKHDWCTVESEFDSSAWASMSYHDLAKELETIYGPALAQAGMAEELRDAIEGKVGAWQSVVWGLETISQGMFDRKFVTEWAKEYAPRLRAVLARYSAAATSESATTPNPTS